MDSDNLQEWLIALVKGLVSKPESVEVEKTTDEMGVLYTVRVSAEDRGKVIGREGSIANAIRTVLRSAGMMINVRASMKVDVPDRDFTPRDRE